MSNSPKVFELNEHVDYCHYVAEQFWITNYGKVIGSATIIVKGKVRNLVMVELTKPFYDSEGEHLVSMLAIHPDSLRASE